MPPGSGLVWKDQQTAERVADERRWAHLALIAELRELNKSLDSHRLHEIIEAQLADLNAY